MGVDAKADDFMEVWKKYINKQAAATGTSTSTKSGTDQTPADTDLSDNAGSDYKDVGSAAQEESNNQHDICTKNAIHAPVTKCWPKKNKKYLRGGGGHVWFCVLPECAENGQWVVDTETATATKVMSKDQ